MHPMHLNNNKQLNAFFFINTLMWVSFIIIMKKKAFLSKDHVFVKDYIQFRFSTIIKTQME